MGFPKGLMPTKVVQDKWWETPKIDDVLGMRPEPKNEVLLIVGDATGVIKDLEEFIKICPKDFDTMCMNYSHMMVPWDIQHFVAGDSHMEDMQLMAKTLPGSCLKHCWNPKSLGFDVRWIRNGRTGWNGTTANLGIKIGIALGYTRIVLAGIPMDTSGNWYAPLIAEDDVKQNKNHSLHLWKWNEIASRPISRLIRSMSGNTADLLGTPTREWIDQALQLKEKDNGEKNKSTGRSRTEVRQGLGVAG